MPDLLRAYGQLLTRDDAPGLKVLVSLVVASLVLLAIYAIGALVQRAYRVLLRAARSIRRARH